VILEFSLVAAILLTKFDWRFAQSLSSPWHLHRFQRICHRVAHGYTAPGERAGLEANTRAIEACLTTKR